MNAKKACISWQNWLIFYKFVVCSKTLGHHDLEDERDGLLERFKTTKNAKKGRENCFRKSVRDKSCFDVCVSDVIKQRANMANMLFIFALISANVGKSALVARAFG